MVQQKHHCNIMLLSECHDTKTCFQAHSENGSDTPRGACGKQVNLSICRTTNAHTLRWGTSGGVYEPCIFSPMLAESDYRWLKVFANGFAWRLLGDNKLPSVDSAPWLKVFANGFAWRLLGDNKHPSVDSAPWLKVFANGFAWRLLGDNKLSSVDSAPWLKVSANGFAWRLLGDNKLPSVDSAPWLKVFANGFVRRLLGNNKLPCLLILLPDPLILHRHAVPSSVCFFLLVLFEGAWGWGRLEEREGKARGCKTVTYVYGWVWACVDTGEDGDRVRYVTHY